jgi:hypothetical protein
MSVRRLDGSKTTPVSARRTGAVAQRLGAPLVLASLLCGCAKRATPAAPSVAASAPPAVSAPNVGRLGTPSGFELTSAASGATLVWAPFDHKDGSLRKVELDASGAFAGTASAALEPGAVTGEATDLTAAWVNQRLALAWVERDGAKARVRAAWAGAAQAPFELGPAWSGPRTARGNVAIAARAERALIFARGDEAVCVDPNRHGCFGFGFHELSAERAEKSGLPMSVPVPCADNSVELAVVRARFHYGVCTDTGERPVTTMFTIERDPDYARADPLLEGCKPAGTFLWHEAAWLVAECEGGRRAVRLGARDEAPEYLDLHALRLECRGGAASIRAPSLDLLLDEPRAALGALLPIELAPAGARAVWAGRALVVATSFADHVQLASYACDGDKLARQTLDVH